MVKSGIIARMNYQQKNPPKLAYFLGVGIGIAILIGLVIILTKLILIGIFLGLIIFAVSWVKQRLFPKKQRFHRHNNQPGRVIEHDEIQ